MSQPEALSPEAIKKELEQLSDWKFENGKLYANFKFKDFNQCFSVMSAVALLSEKMDHHPEWTNVYNQLTVYLTSHFANGVTELDLKMAKFISQKASQAQQ